MVFLQEAGFLQFNGKVQRVLSAERRQDAVRVFFLNDLFDRLHCKRLNIDFVCNLLVRHDCCRVGIDQDDFHPFFAQCAAGLCAGIVKFGCLANDDWPGTDDHYFFDLFSFHSWPPPITLINLSNR